MTKKKKISWKKFEALTRKLAASVRASKYKPDYFVGIARGGLVPLAILAEEFDTRNVATFSAHSYAGEKRGKITITSTPRADMRGKKVLLVDEIVDSGETIRHVAALIAKRYHAREVRTAVIVVNTKRASFAPDYCAMKTGQWVVFPWEGYN
ncbi:MAG: phosphoribosyltransferase family protein [Patescibacteria group bacterium]|nr:phosphoribosyltransferase family protein [Patescibacteria group bacterium]